MSIRLDKLISNLGYGSRKDAVLWAKQGRLTYMDGRPLRKASAKVDATDVLFDGEPLDPLELLLLLHKPKGYTCSHRDRPPLIFELLPERYSHRTPTLSCVGRLDKDTTGLLLLTTNGQLLHRLTSPSWKVKKHYLVETSFEISDAQVQRLAEGGWCLPDDEKPLKPAECRKLASHQLELVLTEGRYHQVKRMMEAVGNPLVKLHRPKLGFLDLDSLPESQWRHLSDNESKRLSESCELSPRGTN